MTKDNARILMKDLMVWHGLADAWDDAEFDKVFNLFEEDEPEPEVEVYRGAYLHGRRLGVSLRGSA